MMMTGSILARIQKLAVQHFTLEVQNLFAKATTFARDFRLLLAMGYFWFITRFSLTKQHGHIFK